MHLRRTIAGFGLVTGLGFLATSVLGLGIVTLTRSAWNSRPVSSFGTACRVTKVTDGNSITVNCGNGDRRVRLMGYATPKIHHPKCAAEKAAGEAETQRMSRLVASGPVTGIRIVGRDASGTDLAQMSIGGNDVAATMLKTSYALPDLGKANEGGKANPDWCGIIAHRQSPSAEDVAVRLSGPTVASGRAAAFSPAPQASAATVLKLDAASASAAAFRPAPVSSPTLSSRTSQAFKPAPKFAAAAALKLRH